MACCFKGCLNTRKRNPDLTFFRFPKKSYRCYLWLKKCNNPNIEKLSHSELQYRVVCEEHFSSKCFDISQLTSGKTRRSLFSFALPEPASVIAKLKKEEEENENNRPTALMDPSALPMKFNLSKGADLASPKKLMSMAENQCPMMRPISPIFLETGDTNESSFIPLFNAMPLLPALSPDEEKRLENTAVSSCPAPLSPVVESSEASSPSPKRLRRQTLSILPKSQEKCTTVQNTKLRKYKKILPKSSEMEAPVVLSVIAVDKKVSLNLSKMGIRNLKRSLNVEENLATKLILDDNSIETLPSISNHYKLVELSLINNKIESLSWFLDMTNLKILKLANNCISNVDVLSKLWHLTYLDLSGNKIQTLAKFEPKPGNLLHHLNLSNNQIHEITCLKNLAKLKELFLHRNKISSLRLWGSLLPTSLKVLYLADNSILNLHNFSELSQMESLESFTITNNPCLNDVLIVDSQHIMLGSPKSFNYVPYLLFWCSSLKHINGQYVTFRDRLKAKWLKDDGKISKLIYEESGKLLTYLTEVCPSIEEFPPMELEEEELPQILTTETVAQEIVPEKSKLYQIKIKKSKESDQMSVHEINLQSTLKEEHKGKKGNVQQGCSFSSCDHYIELIEEKARSYKLQRTNEDLFERIQLLEAVISQNGLSIDDAVIKLENEDFYG